MKKLFTRLYKLFTDKEFILQVIKFGIIGVITSVLDWCILALFVRIFHVDSMVGNIFSFCLSTIFSFWANSRFVFEFDNSKGKKRVFIVQEAEKMTPQAQNALLKTIEEPPDYVVILLLTESEEALLETIRSRCVKLKMRPVPEKVLREALRSREGISEENIALAR